MISAEQKQVVANLLISGSGGFQVHETPKRETELKCSCGALLVEFRRVLLPRGPQTHRKKRITKKWRKRWEKENRHLILASSMMGLLQRPAYRCAQCGKEEGFYSVMGRNLFTVEPMPPGALAVYSEEPTT